MTDTSAIVTGGASGIGAATARALTARGHHVVIGDIDEVGGRGVADEIGGTFAQLDVADPVAWDAVVDQHGPFGVAVLNAGIGTGHPVADDSIPVVDLPNGAYRRIMGINVDGVVFGTRAVLPAMLDAAAGDIVVTASLAGLAPFSRDPVYALTKHAVVGFVRSMAGALDGHGVAIERDLPWLHGDQSGVPRCTCPDRRARSRDHERRRRGGRRGALTRGTGQRRAVGDLARSGAAPVRVGVARGLPGSRDATLTPAIGVPTARRGYLRRTASLAGFSTPLARASSR